LASLAAKQQYDFARERQRCLDLIEKVTSKRLDEDWPENPIFGKISGRISAGFRPSIWITT
jgi:hypothetical protein